MSAERFSWTEPQLCTYDFDIKKAWFVWFDFTDNLTKHSIRKQFRSGINSIKKKEERLLQGNALKAFWKQQLQVGWNPWSLEDMPVETPFVNEAFNRIMEIKSVHCGTRTLQNYRYCIKLLNEWLELKRISRIFIYQFDEKYTRMYMDYLALQKGYAGRTYNDHLVNLSTFCNGMIERDWIEKNPFRKIKKLPIEVGRNIAFSEEEKELLRKYFIQHDPGMYYFTQFIYYCFIRRSELTKLKIQNIDFKNMSIVIPSAASKNKKQESVVIPSSFVPILKEMKLQKLPGDWFLFGRYLKPGPVQYINYNHISTRHNEISKNLGINKEKGLYSWKHSGVCAVYPILQGDMYALMRQLRHSELTTTQIYLKSLGLVDNLAIRNAVW